jgi:hypothetical protein
MNAVRPTRDVIYDMANEYIDAVTRLADSLAAAAGEGTERSMAGGKGTRGDTGE